MNGMEEHLYRVAEITVPILLVMWNNKRKAKKEREKQHEENKKSIDGMKQQLTLCPPHLHTEEKGVLKAEGIFPKRKTA